MIHARRMKDTTVSMMRITALVACFAAMSAIAASAQDLDNDGWSVADGDFYDVPSWICPSPELANPGAFEIPGNGIDDDCDGIVDNPAPTDCSAGPLFSGVDGAALAAAMDLCVTAYDSSPLPQRRWGLLTAELRRSPANAAAPDPLQVAVSDGFGDGFLPLGNATLAVLSTGTARDLDQPGYIAPVAGFSDATNSALPPAEFVAAHGNHLINYGFGCPVQSGSDPVFDMVMLRLRIRVPTNANAFWFDFAFLSSQFPDECTQFNDHFLALLTSGTSGILPADHNIAFDSMARHLTVQTTFFESCVPVPYSPGQPAHTCPFGSDMLIGTGYDPANDGATRWLTSGVTVIPGETITLDFYIFDVGDHYFDATVLLDNFRWTLLPQAEQTAVGDDGPPDTAHLSPVSPNPFNPTTTIAFTLPRSEHVRVAIYDMTGRTVRVLVDGVRGAGTHEVTWNGEDDGGRAMASGVYVCGMDTGDRRETRRVTLVK